MLIAATNLLLPSDSGQRRQDGRGHGRGEALHEPIRRDCSGGGSPDEGEEARVGDCSRELWTACLSGKVLSFRVSIGACHGLGKHQSGVCGLRVKLHGKCVNIKFVAPGTYFACTHFHFRA